jgi:hypothetical protein
VTGFVSDWPGGDDFGVMETDPTPSRTALMVTFSTAFPIKHRAKAIRSVDWTRQVGRFPDPFKKSASTLRGACSFKAKSLVLRGKSLVCGKNQTCQDHEMFKLNHRGLVSHEIKSTEAESKLLHDKPDHGLPL